MLFSNDKISNYINATFEPAWQSVRKSAIVRIDFGNGKTVTRTLNGNIATYICTADGIVLDIIPGVYDPVKYLERLEQAKLLHQWAMQPGRRGKKLTAEQRRKRARLFVNHYHTQQVKSIKNRKEPRVIVEAKMMTIFGVEQTMKLVLKSSLKGKSAGRVARDVSRGRTANNKPIALPPKLSSRIGKLTPNMLKDDSRYNETVRRIKVHELLAKTGPVKPSAITKKVYKEILNTDLDDPYLGLGKVLFGSYPFEDGGK